MLLSSANKVALNRKGGIPAVVLVMAKEENHLPPSTCLSGSWQRLPWFCCQCSGNVSVVELFHMSPRRAELAGEIAVTSLLRHRAGGPASLTPTSQCLSP